MASMLSRGAILAECLVKNSAPKVIEIYLNYSVENYLEKNIEQRSSQIIGGYHVSWTHT